MRNLSARRGGIKQNHGRASGVGALGYWMQ
jgi:hypothetical protein